jgi:hypothetical protein
MDGWELGRLLRKNGFEQTPIIMVSANANELSQARPDSDIHDDVLAKPISLALLLEKIGRLLNLQWIAPKEEPQTVADTPHQAVARKRPVISPLNAKQVDGLRQLALIGYVRGLRDELDALDQEMPSASEYIGFLRDLVGEFRLDAFLEILDAELPAPVHPDLTK